MVPISQAQDPLGLSLRVSARLNAIEEAERWVLSWGGRATVVRPQALRDRLLGVGQGYVRRYAQSGG
jgi:hypothetical protein